MPRVDPLTLVELEPTEKEAVLRAGKLMGFVANDALTMARKPEIMHAFAGLVGSIYQPSRIDDGLKRLIGLVASSAAGCQYCVAHTAFSSTKHGISQDKLDRVWEFETDSAFSEAERAALRVALHAGQTPNAVDDTMFQALAEHFDTEQQLEIVAVIALFGFLNRWNATLATDIESSPMAAYQELNRNQLNES